jgi:hypothetical protein
MAATEARFTDFLVAQASRLCSLIRRAVPAAFLATDY